MNIVFKSDEIKIVFDAEKNQYDLYIKSVDKFGDAYFTLSASYPKFTDVYRLLDVILKELSK